jgi:hypothetical protein
MGSKSDKKVIKSKRKRSISCPYSLSYSTICLSRAQQTSFASLLRLRYRSPLIAGVVSYDRGSRFSWFQRTSYVLFQWFGVRNATDQSGPIKRQEQAHYASYTAKEVDSMPVWPVMILCTLPVQMEVYSSPQCRWTSVYTHSGTTVGLHFPRVFSVFGDPKTVIVGKCHPMSCNRTWKSSLKGKTAHFS